MLDGVDQRDLVVDDEIGIVGRAALRVVAVKAAHRPVDGPDPVDVITDFDGVHELLLSMINHLYNL